jgi:hypothetical protein
MNMLGTQVEALLDRAVKPALANRARSERMRMFGKPHVRNLLGRTLGIDR